MRSRLSTPNILHAHQKHGRETPPRRGWPIPRAGGCWPRRSMEVSASPCSAGRTQSPVIPYPIKDGKRLLGFMRVDFGLIGRQATAFWGVGREPLSQLWGLQHLIQARLVWSPHLESRTNYIGANALSPNGDEEPSSQYFRPQRVKGSDPRCLNYAAASIQMIASTIQKGRAWYWKFPKSPKTAARL